jgi:hypothetical protein
MTVFEREYEAVEGQLEEPVGVVADPCALDTCQCGVAIRRKGLLRLAVCVIPAVDIAARGPAGFGQRVTDDQPADAVEPVGGLLLAQAEGRLLLRG